LDEEKKELAHLDSVTELVKSQLEEVREKIGDAEPEQKKQRTR
jgi:hypothetical protein